jgi:predicted house-cleaning noncanonical NTP pyrophosphatase (MazG superfamily)
MNHENRVAALVSQTASAERTEAFERLLDAPPLTPAETSDLCGFLAAETDRGAQGIFWKLLDRSAPSAQALDLALNGIMNPAASNRGEAVRYLRFCFPDRLPALLDAFARDPDEEVRYQLSEFVRDSDMEAAVGMKIKMLRQASPALQEKLVSEIAEFGNLNHLEALRGLDQLSGVHSVFARAAELLAARTRESRAQASGGPA